MSTGPTGPGWWQATDGRWYAPEQHPAWRPAPLAPPAAAPPPAARAAAASRSPAIPLLVTLVVLLAAAGAAVALVTVTSSPVSFASEPASHIAAAAQAAAHQAGSVTIATRATSPTGKSTTELQTSTADTGSQHAGGTAARIQDRCVPGTCYVEGNEAGLAQAFQMPATLAAANAGTWLSLRAGSATPGEARMYAAVLTSTTLRSLLRRPLVPSGLHVAGTTTLDGQAVVELRGTHVVSRQHLSEAGTWYVSVRAPHVLLEAAGTATGTATGAGGTATFRSTYTRWGTTGAAAAPARSVPFPTAPAK